MNYSPPAAPAVRDMLDRILASETFSRSERARSLLSYIVTRAEAGEADLLKGYAIAVDVFGKDSAFDASTDAVVRVQAGRLRELLVRYYETEGCSDPIRIVIPRGSYVPNYETGDGEPAAVVPPANLLPDPSESADDRSGEEPGAVSSPPVRSPGAGQIRLLWAAFGLLAMLVVAVAYRADPVDFASVGFENRPIRDQQATGDAGVAAMDALPTLYIHAQGSDPAVANVARVLRSAFAGFDTIAMIGGDPPAVDQGKSGSPDGFVLSVARGIAFDGVVLELQSLGSGKVLLNRRLPQALTGPQQIESPVAAIATSIAPTTGVIYGYLRQSGVKPGLTDCLIRSNAYYMNQTAQRHLDAYRCLEGLAAANSRSPLVYSELSALTVEARTNGFAYPAAPTDELAMNLARRSVQLGPASPFAHRAMGFLYSRKGDTVESVRWMGKAYQFNIYDLSMAASYGYALVFAGNYQDGATVLQHAVEASSAHPTWWDYSLFLAKFMLDDRLSAARASDALVSPRKWHYLAAQLVAARARGEGQRAEALVSEIAAAYPKFAADPAAMFRQSNYPGDLAVKFSEALRTAGLGRQS